MNKNKLSLFVLALLFLATAFAARLSFIPSDRLWPDEALYASQAAEIARAPLFLLSPEANEFHVPLFSFFLSFGKDLLNPSVEGYRLLAIIFNWLGLLATFLLAKKLLGIRTAVFALAFLALNSCFFDSAGLILIDSPLTAAQVFFIIALCRLERSSKTDVAVVLLSALVMIYLKWYAILFVLPLVLGYFVIFPSGWNIRKVLLWPAVIVLASVPILIKIVAIMKAGGPATYHPLPWWHYFSLYLVITGGLVPLIFGVYGAIVLKAKKPQVFSLLALWLFVYFGILSCVSEKDLRYILPVMPCVAILSGYGLQCAIAALLDSSRIRGAAYKAAMIAMLVMSVAVAAKNDAPFLYGYTGFYEAGAWISAHCPPDAPVLAGSTRAIRFTTGIPLKKYEGRLESLPASLDELKTVLEHAKDIIVEIDRWEYTQPPWAYPLTEEKKQRLLSAGLQLSKVVYKKFAGQSTPIVWLFTKSPPR